MRRLHCIPILVIAGIAVGTFLVGWVGSKVHTEHAFRAAWK
jgi:hypothetical protein